MFPHLPAPIKLFDNYIIFFLQLFLSFQSSYINPLINIITFVNFVLFSFVIAEILVCNYHINGLVSLTPLAKSCSFVLRYMEALSKVGCIH
jgi:hypothetical protein